MEDQKDESCVHLKRVSPNRPVSETHYNKNIAIPEKTHTEKCPLQQQSIQEKLSGKTKSNENPATGQ